MDYAKEKSLSDQLESLVDKHSVLDVLIGLELVCMDKADHIIHNWQDNTTAKAWRAAERVCGAAARKVGV